jgi:hypothetical protein
MQATDDTMLARMATEPTWSWLRGRSRAAVMRATTPDEAAVPADVAEGGRPRSSRACARSC